MTLASTKLFMIIYKYYDAFICTWYYGKRYKWSQKRAAAFWGAPYGELRQGEQDQGEHHRRSIIMGTPLKKPH